MKKVVIFVIVFILLGGAVAAYVAYGRLNRPFRGYSESEAFVEIPGGAGSRAIGDRLIAAGIVRDRLTYRVALWRSGHARRLKAGEYRFDGEMTPLEVVDKIARGDVFLLNLTFREGLTITEMAQIFETNGFGPAKSFVAAAGDGSLIQNVDPSARDLEGYLFPDTYALPRGADASRVVRAMVDRFQQVLTPEIRKAAEARGLTVRQLVTLASIVEKETAKPEERPLVAAVYSNRLKIGMGLQCDPTVIYALQRAGRYDGNLRRDDLQFDSPYNTYRYPGLPPGPIAAPGKGSLEAAAAPADVDFVYFVSRNDGSHEFARTLEEHNRNVQKYQIQYFRDKRREQQGR
jgi:peptidoglycan lytic transglycosylase G